MKAFAFVLRTVAVFFSFSLVAPVAGAETLPCGPEAPCEVDGGDYHLLFPDKWDGRSALPALVFFHGHRSSGASVYRSPGLKSAFADYGYLIIAPNGAVRPGSGIRAWPARPVGGDQRDDVAFALDVIDDVAERVPLDRDRIFVSGFSAGGSMAWMMACYAGDRFAGAVSVAGALRRPVPTDGRCPAGPVRVLQVHGFSDTQVPFEGRGIRDWHQGDVFESLSLMRATNGCRSNPDRIDIGADFRCRTWDKSCGGKAGAETSALRLCIHDGGHGLPSGWTDLARDWFERPSQGQ